MRIVPGSLCWIVPHPLDFCATAVLVQREVALGHSILPDPPSSSRKMTHCTSIPPAADVSDSDPLDAPENGQAPVDAT